MPSKTTRGPPVSPRRSERHPRARPPAPPGVLVLGAALTTAREALSLKSATCEGRSGPIVTANPAPPRSPTPPARSRRRRRPVVRAREHSRSPPRRAVCARRVPSRDRGPAGVPRRPPARSPANSDPPSSAKVSPSRYTASPGRGKPPAPAEAMSSSKPSMPITGVGQIAESARLVVEAHVAAGDRRVQREAGLADPLIDSANCHITTGRSGSPKLRQFVIASDARARDRDVAGGLGHRVHRTEVGIERPYRPFPSIDSASAFIVPARDDRRIAPGRRPSAPAPSGRTAPTPALRRDVRGREHRPQRLAQVALERRERRVVGDRRHRRALPRPVVLRARRRRARAPAPRLHARPRSRHVSVPPSTSSAITAICRPHRSQTARTSSSFEGRHDREHPLLRLAREDLERLHARFAQRHRVEVERGAHARSSRRLAHRARDAGAAQVLQPLEQASAISSSDASIRSFSANGSPICTEGRDPRCRRRASRSRARSRRRCRRGRWRPVEHHERAGVRGERRPSPAPSASRGRRTSRRRSGSPSAASANRISPPTVGTPMQLP